MTISRTRAVGAALVAAVAVAALSAAAIGAAAAPGPANGLEPALGAAAVPATPGNDALPADVGALTGDLDAVLAAERSAAPDGQLRAGRGELRRLAAFRRLVHATVVVDLPDRGLTTIQLDHGTIASITGDSLSIAEAGGTSVTVAIGAETRVRKDGEKAAIADLTAGDEVFVMSRVEGGSSEAYLVVVPRAGR